MDVRVGLWRRLSAKELMLLNCGVREGSWESLGLQRDQTKLKEINPEYSLEGLMLKLKLQYFGHLKSWLTGRLWCWEGLGAGEGDDRGWDGWMASLTQWTRVWVNSRSWWWTGRPGVLQFMGSQRVGHDWATELNRTELNFQRNPRADLLQNGLVGSPCSPRNSQESSPAPQFKSINSLALNLLHSPTLTSLHDHRKNHSLD